MDRTEPLPIDSHLPALAGLLAGHGKLVLKAPPGAGKTTRVPPALLQAGLAGNGMILVLEPRRIAARAAARRMAFEQGQAPGDAVGYQIRFETVASDATRILVVTEGILTRRLQGDPFLEGVSLVILDEFHERSIHTDLALAFLKELTEGARPDLKVVVMSATLDPDPLSAFLGGCPVMEIPVEGHPLEVSWLDRRDERPLPIRVAGGIDRALHAVPEGGDILVFLPGMAEIWRTGEAVKELARRHRCMVVPLHGDLPGAAQDRAIQPQKKRKIILTTNIAETSLTIEGVAVVVDSGWAKVLRHDPRCGLDRLEMLRISKASAEQRAGRAGRTGPGLALRLWTRGEHASLADQEVPEILRVDLASTLLDVLAWGAPDPERFGWFEPPPRASIHSALRLLERLGALRPGTHRLTPVGEALLRLPMHPRLGRILIEAERRGMAREGALMAALLSERDVLLPARTSCKERGAGPPFMGPSDLLHRLDLVREAERARFEGKRLEALQIDPSAARTVEKASRQYLRLLGSGTARRGGGAAGEEGLLRIAAAGFPDRVARRKRKGSGEFIMVGGRGAVLARDSVARKEDLILGLSVEGGRKGLHARSIIRIASRVDAGWLREDFPELIRTEKSLAFEPKRERVEGFERLLFDDLPLEERALSDIDPGEASLLLAGAASRDLDAALSVDGEAAGFLERVRFLRECMPGLGLPPFDQDDLQALLPEICAGRKSFEETRRVPLLPLLKRRLSGKQLALLEEHAPERILVPSGRRVPLDYRAGRPPMLSVRLQEVFGLLQTPSVAGGRVRILMDLLGPNLRTVQRTEDLENFWKATYAQVRKDLRARYPKHAWPEDPFSAKPSGGSGRRRKP